MSGPPMTRMTPLLQLLSESQTLSLDLTDNIITEAVADPTPVIGSCRAGCETDLYIG